MPSKEPRPASHFRLDLGGRQGVGMFRECSGLDSETSVIEHKSIDDQGRPVVRKVPGEIKWSNITLDYSGSTIATWSFDQGWPIKYTGATLNAGGNEVAVEEIQICHEGLKRV